MWTEIEPGSFIPSPEKNKTTLPIYLTSQISPTSCLKNQTKRDFLSFFFYHRSRIEQTILDENFPTFYTPTLKNRRPNPQSRRPIDPPRSSKTNKKKKTNEGTRSGENIEGARIGRKVVAAARRERVSIGP